MLSLPQIKCFVPSHLNIKKRSLHLYVLYYAFIVYHYSLWIGLYRIFKRSFRFEMFCLISVNVLNIIFRVYVAAV